MRTRHAFCLSNEFAAIFACCSSFAHNAGVAETIGVDDGGGDDECAVDDRVATTLVFDDVGL